MSELPSPHTWRAPVLDHDDLCPVVATDLPQCPQCALIAKVRADEARAAKESAMNVAVAGSRLMLAEDIAAVLADLRAKVEALRDEAMNHTRSGEQTAAAIVAYQTVLALIDGSSDE